MQLARLLLMSGIVCNGALALSCAPSAADAGGPLDASDRGLDGGDAAKAALVPHPPALHRATGGACTVPPGPGTFSTCRSVYPTDAGDCDADQDCTAGTNGRCNCEEVGSSPAQANMCGYDECTSDTDCKNGKACFCRTNPNDPRQTYCFTDGNCLADSDCGPGGYCSPATESGCFGSYGYFCHTANDECIDDTDCTQGNSYCAYDENNTRWFCSTGMCVDG